MTKNKKNKNQKEEFRGDQVTVLCVLKRNAKSAKQALEGIHALNKRYRMVPSIHHSDCIAIPIVVFQEPSKDNQDHSHDVLQNASEDPSDANIITRTVEEWKQTYEWDWIQHIDRQLCPYSTAVLGNHPHPQYSSNLTNKNNRSKASKEDVDGNIWTEGLHTGQQALYHVLCTLAPHKSQDGLRLQQEIQSLEMTICPKKLEILGDDRALVLPPTAFPISTVDQLLQNHVLSSAIDGICDGNPKNGNGDVSNHLEELRGEFWKQLAVYHKSQRIARRGTVDPESKIRESGHRLVWPNQGIPDETGPGSPGWIRVTEQGIGQSFDMCRVMFSRGNISEKIRFGKLVQPGERLLDMYAGIGYYTLPALVIGRAAHVVACEWNEHAVRALKFNVQDNKIASNRVTILQGDCRVSAKEHRLVNQFDRISLGLLPSAEGGWRTAIQALGPDGGWLHIHANVPVAEVDDWSFWMSRELWNLVKEERSDKLNSFSEDNKDRSGKWIVLCHHVEKVKSFAPTVAHYVADVYVGGISGLEASIVSQMNDAACTAVVVLKDGGLVSCSETIKPPSCALSPDGVLSQAWMR